MKFEVSYKKFDKEEGGYKRVTEFYNKELTCEQKEIYNHAKNSTPCLVFIMTVVAGIIAGSIGLLLYSRTVENPNIIHFLAGELTTFVFSTFVPFIFYLDYRQTVKVWKETEKDIINSIRKELQDEQKKIAEEYYREHPEKFMAIYKLKED